MIWMWLLLPIVPPGDADHRHSLSQYGAALLKQKRGEWPAAQSLLLSVQKADPQAIEPLRALLTVQSSLARYPAAIRTGQQIIAADPNDHRTALHVARLLLDGQQPAEAMRLLKPFTTQSLPPATMVDVLESYAKACERSGDGANAEKALLHRVELFQEKGASIQRMNGLTEKEFTSDFVDAWESLGKQRIAIKQPIAAAQAFFEADKLRPNAKRLNLQLARTFAASDDAEKAISYYQKSLAQSSTDPAVLIELIEYRFSHRQAIEAVRQLDSLLKIHPKRTDIAWLLLTGKVRTGDVEPPVAVLQFEEWAKKSCDPALIDVAVTSLPASEVLMWFDALAKQANPEFGSNVKKDLRTGPILRAVSDSIRKRPALAGEFIDFALQALRTKNTTHHRTFEFAGWLAERAGRLADAESAMRAIASESYDRTRPLIALLERQFRWQDVVIVLQPYTATNNQNIQALFVRAYCEAELGNVRKATEIVNQLVRDERLFAESKFTIRLQQCRILTASGQANESIQLAIKLFDMANNPAEISRVRMTLGDAYFAAGRVKEGEAQMRAILEEDPDDALALNNLAYNLAESNRGLADAELMARHALAQDRDDRRRGGDPAASSGTYLDTLGWVLYKREKLAEARTVFEEALALPDASFNPVVWDHYGDVLIKLDESTLAIQAWTKAMNRLPDTHEGKRSGKRDAVKAKIDAARK